MHAMRPTSALRLLVFFALLILAAPPIRGQAIDWIESAQAPPSSLASSARMVTAQQEPERNPDHNHPSVVTIFLRTRTLC